MDRAKIIQTYYLLALLPKLDLASQQHLCNEEFKYKKKQITEKNNFWKTELFINIQ